MMQDEKRGPVVLIWNRILVGLDGSDRSMAAVRYAASVLAGSATCRIRLVAVMVPPEADNFPEADQRAAEEERRRRELTQALEQGKSLLLDAGLPDENLSLDLLTAQGEGIGRLLMDYQRKNGFGTVVVGRRGLSKAEEFLFGSVSNTVVHQATDCCVWVVG
jgi:nucleotide-binding universal stress UspA family protein